MCGVTGILAYTEVGEKCFENVDGALSTLTKRGPDNFSIYKNGAACLGHTRLSIIDTSESGNQPFKDPTGRYILVFNGEIYNYQELRDELVNDGVQFVSHSDTEVLLHLLIKKGADALNMLNGFFAFAFYDKEQAMLLVGRDRMGIKPLVYYSDNDKFIFASEMKALLEFNQPRKISEVALSTYFTLNYIPAPHTILENHYKLPPGHYLTVKQGKVDMHKWWSIPVSSGDADLSYEAAQEQLRHLMSESVKKRLISDVPIGTFLSGGIDSSVVSAVAAAQTDNLHTFSLGFKDAPYFDETKYAEAVSKKIGSDHTTFSVTLADMYDHLEETVQYLDEPFADSSCLAVSLLAKYTRQHVTVALSGDGADELFSGYYKHAAEFKTRSSAVVNSLIKNTLPFWRMFPQSRNSALGNKFRQIVRYGEGLKLDTRERYWKWASILESNEVSNLLKDSYAPSQVEVLKQNYLEGISTNFNSVLTADLQLVLPNDMLNKVDLMSMSHSLEVRTPFLDHELVSFVQSLPSKYKINGQMRKRILQDTYRNDLPAELYNRSKKGFEIPLNQWFKTSLKEKIENKILNRSFIEEQGIFNVDATEKLKEKLFSSNPGDSTATAWALLVFQEWWHKYMS